MMEKERVKISQERTGGIFSWIGVKDETIYNYFLKERDNAQVPFKVGELVETSSLLKNNVRLAGRISEVNYDENWCDVVIWRPDIKKEIRRYPFSELSPL